MESSIAEKAPAKVWTAAELLKLSVSERAPLLQAMAEEAAPLYAADLALPHHERELTAFSALDGADPILEDY